MHQQKETTPPFRMPYFLVRLKQQAEENPIMAIAVIGASMRGAAKLIDAFSGIRSRNAYARRTNRKK